MRAWVFLHRKGSYIKRGNVWTQLYDEVTEYDRARSVRTLFPETIQFTNEGEITPMRVLLNAYCNNDERIHMLSSDCMYYAIPYILSLINVDLNASDMVELELHEQDISCAVNVIDMVPVRNTWDTIMHSVDNQMGLIGLMNNLRLDNVVGWYRMSKWGRNIIFEPQKLHKPCNPSIRCPVSVTISGEPQRRDGGTFSPLSQFDVYNQKLEFGLERAEKDMTLATAFEACCRKQNTMLAMRIRKLKIDHSAYMSTYISDILSKRDEGSDKL